jgi:hypothetical protein
MAEILCYPDRDPFWWRHPDPVIDSTRIKLNKDDTGPSPEPRRAELTKLDGILAAVGNFKDSGSGYQPGGPGES